MNEVKRPKKPLFFYYTIVMLLILLGNLVLMPWMQQRRGSGLQQVHFHD